MMNESNKRCTNAFNELSACHQCRMKSGVRSLDTAVRPLRLVYLQEHLLVLGCLRRKVLLRIDWVGLEGEGSHSH